MTSQWRCRVRVARGVLVSLTSLSPSLAQARRRFSVARAMVRSVNSCRDSYHTAEGSRQEGGVRTLVDRRVETDFFCFLF
jgi:hypothetical protein